MSDNLTTLSFNTTQYNKPLFAFDKKSFFLNRGHGNKTIFRKRKRKTNSSDNIITRVGKIPSELYACYHLHMSCLEELRTLCFTSDYYDLLELIKDVQSCLSIYSAKNTKENFREEYEDLTQHILTIAVEYEARAESPESRALTLKLAVPSKESLFSDEMLSRLSELPFNFQKVF